MQKNFLLHYLHRLTLQSIVSHVTIVGIPVGIAGASLTLMFTVTTGAIKKLLNITRKKKKKQ